MGEKKGSSITGHTSQRGELTGVSLGSGGFFDDLHGLFTSTQTATQAVKHIRATVFWSSIGKSQMGGGKRIVRFWGPKGGNVLYSAPSTPVLEPSDQSGICLVCAPFPLRRMTLREQRGGGTRIISGRVQNRFWGGAFVRMFSPPRSSPPPFCFSLILKSFYVVVIGVAMVWFWLCWESASLNKLPGVVAPTSQYRTPTW